MAISTLADVVRLQAAERPDAVAITDDLVIWSADGRLALTKRGRVRLAVGRTSAAPSADAG